MDDVVYQENRLCLIIFDHICSRKILEISYFMFHRVEEHHKHPQIERFYVFTG